MEWLLGLRMGLVPSGCLALPSFRMLYYKCKEAKYYFAPEQQNLKTNTLTPEGWEEQVPCQLSGIVPLVLVPLESPCKISYHIHHNNPNLPLRTLTHLKGEG